MKPKIIIAGGSGFVGQALTTALLARGYDVVILTRQPPQRADGATEVQWNGKDAGEWVTKLEGAEAVINLTGKSVNSRHTPAIKREILDSRVNSVRALGHAVEAASIPPKAFIQASGIGVYQDRGDAWSDESASHGSDFMAQVCEQWEGAFNGIDAPNTRKVILRLGVVMGPNGGFLKLLGKLTRWFLGGHVGSGRQFISWIHIDDLTRMFLRAIEDNSIAGVFNATAPNPVRNSEFMRELRRALHRPWSPPVPVFAARIGSAVMGTEAELALVSQRCTPKRFLESGFQFHFPELRPALNNLYPNI
jgi:uncharacterized protein (TIGR01777 family)